MTEVKYLSPFFWLAAILSAAKPQFFSWPASAKLQISQPVAGLAKLWQAQPAA